MENNQQTIDREPEWKKPTLVVGEEYEVAKYPEDERVKATYLGKGSLEGHGGSCHVFANWAEDSITYIRAYNHWLYQRKLDKVLAYHPFSSFSIWFITKEQIKQLPEPTERDTRKSDLTKLLNELGEEI